MKNFIIGLICTCSIIILQSCSSWGRYILKTEGTAVKAKVSATAPENKIVINNELREFLKKNPNAKMVVRVPTSTTGGIVISESWLGGLYGSVERELINAGYTVIDRNLLSRSLTIKFYAVEE
jgi:hypothetical protein